MVTATAPVPSRRFHYPSEFFVTLGALIFTILVVHATYVAWVRPTGDSIIAAEVARMHSDPNYVPERSFLLVIDAPEQEVEIIHFVWAMLIIAYKALLIRRERKLLDRDLIHVPEGIKVLPEDAKDYARQLEQVAPEEKGMLIVRALQRTLDRFASTRSIRDSAETSRAVCDSEADRLDSGLAMIRYIAWAIPAIGFMRSIASRISRRSVVGAASMRPAVSATRNSELGAPAFTVLSAAATACSHRVIPSLVRVSIEGEVSRTSNVRSPPPVSQ